MSNCWIYNFLYACISVNKGGKSESHSAHQITPRISSRQAYIRFSFSYNLTGLVKRAISTLDLGTLLALNPWSF